MNEEDADRKLYPVLAMPCVRVCVCVRARARAPVHRRVKGCLPRTAVPKGLPGPCSCLVSGIVRRLEAGRWAPPVV